MFPGVIHENIKALVLRLNFRHRALPGVGLGHIQGNTCTSPQEFLLQLFRIVATRMNAQPNEITII